MIYVYVLQKQKSNAIYIGITRDLRRRFKEHNALSNSWRLVYYEAYQDERDARLREKRLKYYGKALTQLKRRLNFSLGMPFQVRGKGEKAR